MVLNNFIKAACLSTCLGLASGSALANYSVETNGGLNVYDSADSDHWFNLTGKMQLDTVVNHTGTSLSAVNGSLNLRAVNAQVQGGVGQNLSYSFRLKNASQGVAMDQARISYSGFNSWSKVSVGQVSMPYGLSTSFTENSMASQMFAPQADSAALGVAFTAWNDKLGFTCSLHQPTKAAIASIASFDSAARLSFAPLMRDNLIVHVGANAFMQQNAGDFSSKLTNVAENKQSVTIDGKTRGFCLDAAVLRGPLFLQAEVHQASGSNQDAKAYSVEASYALTGESRDYNKVTGSFSNIRTERDGGSWQVSARHSGVHQNTDVHRTVGAGVAWTVNNNLTVLANYENVIGNNDGALSLRLNAAW